LCFDYCFIEKLRLANIKIFKPITTSGQILMAFEGFMGVFLMSLFVVTFTKQAFED
jgi:hypothetical protein